MTVARRLAPRLAAALGALVAISVLLFAATEVIPGDAASASLGASAPPEKVEALRQQLGLDRNPAVRYADWIWGVARGDLGTSTQTRRPVQDMIGSAALNTAILAALAWVVTVAVSLTLGVIAGTRPGSRRDIALSTGALLVVAVPQFVWAVALIAVFALALSALPAVSLVPAGGTPLDDPAILVLPALSLVMVGGAWATRMVRAAVAATAAAPNVEAARLAGLPERRVIARHLLPGALGPCAQAFAWLTAELIGTAAIVEHAFNYPGLTQLLVSAARSHDVAVLEAVGLLLAAVVSIAFVLADLATVAASPRARTST